MSDNASKETVIEAVSVSSILKQAKPPSWGDRLWLAAACIMILTDLFIWGMYAYGGMHVGYRLLTDPRPPNFHGNVVLEFMNFIILMIIPPTMLVLSVRWPYQYIRAARPARAFFSALGMLLLFLPWFAMAGGGM